MKLVVVGGHSRGIGKTALTAGIIEATSNLHWTALKITQHGHDVCSRSGEDCGCAPAEPECPVAIDRELDPRGCSDTSRFLAAGAAEVYWVRTRMGQLRAALPEIDRLAGSREFVIIESNSILEFLNPDLYLPVLRYDVHDFKDSSRRFLDRADAYVVSGPHPGEARWDDIDPALVAQRPVFPVDGPPYISPDIVSFVVSRLGVGGG